MTAGPYQTAVAAQWVAQSASYRPRRHARLTRWLRAYDAPRLGLEVPPVPMRAHALLAFLVASLRREWGVRLGQTTQWGSLGATALLLGHLSQLHPGMSPVPSGWMALTWVVECFAISGAGVVGVWALLDLRLALSPMPDLEAEVARRWLVEHLSDEADVRRPLMEWLIALGAWRNLEWGLFQDLHARWKEAQHADALWAHWQTLPPEAPRLGHTVPFHHLRRWLKHAPRM